MYKKIKIKDKACTLLVLVPPSSFLLLLVVSFLFLLAKSAQLNRQPLPPWPQYVARCSRADARRSRSVSVESIIRSVLCDGCELYAVCGREPIRRLDHVHHSHHFLPGFEETLLMLMLTTILSSAHHQ